LSCSARRARALVGGECRRHRGARWRAVATGARLRLGDRTSCTGWLGRSQLLSTADRLPGLVCIPLRRRRIPFAVLAADRQKDEVRDPSVQVRRLCDKPRARLPAWYFPADARVPARRRLDLLQRG